MQRLQKGPPIDLRKSCFSCVLLSLKSEAGRRDGSVPARRPGRYRQTREMSQSFDWHDANPSVTAVYSSRQRLWVRAVVNVGKKIHQFVFLIFKFTPGADNHQRLQQEITTILKLQHLVDLLSKKSQDVTSVNKKIHFSRSFLLNNKASGGNSWECHLFLINVFTCGIFQTAVFGAFHNFSTPHAPQAPNVHHLSLALIKKGKIHNVSEVT